MDLTSASFTDVNIDPSSNYVGFDATRLTFDSNHIYLNLQGLDANGFLRVNFDGNNVPEPDSLLLFGAALAALVVTRQKLSK